MSLHSQSLSVECVVHWAFELGRLGAGEASLEGITEDWRPHMGARKMRYP